MANRNRNEDILLVRECLSGSDKAWNEFYCRYVGLVRSVVRRQLAWAVLDFEDVVQNIFLALIPALKTYDEAYSLARFICVVSERVCIQEYRQGKAAKRDGDTDPIDHHGSGQEGYRTVASEQASQEERLAENEMVQMLRGALGSLGVQCRELLTLRYYEDLPYKEISRIMGGSENTLTVKARRCLDELIAGYHEVIRKGVQR